METLRNLLLAKPKTHPNAYSQSREKIVVLRYSRHCDKCSIEVERSCEKMKGVTRVTLDDENPRVTVQGIFDVDKLVKHICKRNNKIVTVVEQRSVEEDDSSSQYTSTRGGYRSSEDDLESFHRYH